MSQILKDSIIKASPGIGFAYWQLKTAKFEKESGKRIYNINVENIKPDDVDKYMQKLIRDLKRSSEIMRKLEEWNRKRENYETIKRLVECIK